MRQINDPTLRDELTKIRQAGNEIDLISRKVFNLIDSNQLPLAQAEAQALSVSELAATGENIDEYKQQLLSAKYRQLENAMNTLTMMAALGMFIAATLAIVLALVISSRISRTLNDSISIIASSSNQIASTTEQQERNASQQAGAISQTTATMDELGEAARSMAEQAESSPISPIKS